MTRARLLTGLDLPEGTVVLYEDESSSWFPSDGTIKWVFELDPEYERRIMGNCVERGWASGPFAETGAVIDFVEENVDVNAEACYQFKEEDDGLRKSLAIVTGSRLLVLRVY